jgi:hypothetical protein
MPRPSKSHVWEAIFPVSSAIFCFYHGTILEKAKEIMTMDIEPFAVSESLLFKVNEHTDFGKGFYTHPEESK